MSGEQVSSIRVRLATLRYVEMLREGRRVPLVQLTRDVASDPQGLMADLMGEVERLHRLLAAKDRILWEVVP